MVVRRSTGAARALHMRRHETVNALYHLDLPTIAAGFPPPQRGILRAPLLFLQKTSK
jgi:hypothetical protein